MISVPRASVLVLSRDLRPLRLRLLRLRDLRLRDLRLRDLRPLRDPLLLRLPVHRLEVHGIGRAVRDVPHDLARVEAAVLDEPAAGLVASTHGAGEVDAGRLVSNVVSL